jgi:hypothetical protein
MAALAALFLTLNENRLHGKAPDCFLKLAAATMPNYQQMENRYLLIGLSPLAVKTWILTGSGRPLLCLTQAVS